jgi:hypothetical protein
VSRVQGERPRVQVFFIYAQDFLNLFAQSSEHRAQDFSFLLCALHSALLNFVHYHKMPLIPMYDTRKRHFIAELFPGKTVVARAVADAFRSIADAKH